jgi:monoterpene epsilon-lactone hydrolase
MVAVAIVDVEKSSSSPAQPPLAPTVSEAARVQLAPLLAAVEHPLPEMSVEQMRGFAEVIGAPIIAARLARYGVVSDRREMGGVPIELVRSAGVDAREDGPLLINLHGGGFTVDSGSLSESVPIAALTGLPVAAVLYRLAPEHVYPAAVDDALAVYQYALRTRKPTQIGIFGTSAGAILAMQLMARIKREGLPMPAAAGIFSGGGDLARPGDSEGYLPPLLPGKTAPEVLSSYVGESDPYDPAVSPLFGDLSGFPPCLLMTSTRDQLLSQTVILHLALRAAGVAAELEVYEGMPHAFWSYLNAPEADAALLAQAAFLMRDVSQ